MHAEDTSFDEEWRSVAGFEGVYSVSNRGRIRRDMPYYGMYEGHILKPYVNRKGYHQINLTYGPKKLLLRTYVHILVARAFLGPCPDGQEVNHDDGIKAHNDVGNLEYTTRQGNTEHAVRTGLVRRGGAHHNALLTDEAVLSIRAEYTGGGVTQKELGERYGVTEDAIGHVTRRERYAHI